MAVPGVSRDVFLKKKTVLFSAAPGGPSATLKGDYPFAIQFPATADGRPDDALPPSYTVYQPGITTDVAYSFRVDIVRKGFRRHEKYAHPFPPAPALADRGILLLFLRARSRAGCLCRCCTCPSRARRCRP